MRKLQTADAGLMQLAIREELNRSEESRYAPRAARLAVGQQRLIVQPGGGTVRRGGDHRATMGAPI